LHKVSIRNKIVLHKVSIRNKIVLHKVSIRNKIVLHKVSFRNKIVLHKVSIRNKIVLHKVSIRNKIVLHKVNLWLTGSSPCTIISLESYCTTHTWDRLRHERRHHPAWTWWLHRKSVVPGSVGQGCSRGCGSRGHPRRSCCQGTSWSKEVEQLVHTNP